MECPGCASRNTEFAGRESHPGSAIDKYRCRTCGTTWEVQR